MGLLWRGSPKDPLENPSLSAEKIVPVMPGFFMPFYAYILVSEATGRRYFGSCEDMEKRLAEHNAGKVRSSKAYRPTAYFTMKLMKAGVKPLPGKNILKRLMGIDI